jgi:hypothetical protein
MTHDPIHWALIAYLAVGALGSIAIIGKPRKPLTHGQAIFVFVVSLAFILVLVLS